MIPHDVTAVGRGRGIATMAMVRMRVPFQGGGATYPPSTGFGSFTKVCNGVWTMNRFELFEAMVLKTVVKLRAPNGLLIEGLIQAVEMEDGSGHCFNVRLLPSNGKAILKLFVRT